MNSGEISVPAITFFEIVKRLPSGSDVILSMGDEDTELILKCGSSKFNISTLKTEDFPILSDKDFFSKKILKSSSRFYSILGGHPEFDKVPGVEASTGALGHGSPIGLGIALGAKIEKKKS